MQTRICTLQSLMKFVLTPKSKVMRRKLVHSLTRQFQTAVLKLQKDIFFYCLQISINDIELPHPPIISLNRRSDLRSFTKLIIVIVSCISGKPSCFVKGKDSFYTLWDPWSPANCMYSPPVCSLIYVLLCENVHV